MNSATNHRCPDYSSHEQNARDRLFPGTTDETLFNITECDEITREAEAEYQACEGH